MKDKFMPPNFISFIAPVLKTPSKDVLLCRDLYHAALIAASVRPCRTFAHS